MQASGPEGQADAAYPDEIGHFFTSPLSGRGCQKGYERRHLSLSAGAGTATR